MQEEAVETPADDRMNKSVYVIAAICGFLATPSLAATVENTGTDPEMIIVTEDGKRTEISIAAGETVNFCSAGCFVTMPNGDREVLTGTETLEISGGRGRIR